MRRRWIGAALRIGLAPRTGLGIRRGARVGTGFGADRRAGFAAGLATILGAALLTADTASAQGLPAQPPPAQPWIINDEVQPPPAEQAPPKPTRTRGQKPSAFEHDPDLDAADQLSPAQVQQQIPDAVAMPSGGSHTRAAARSSDVVLEPGAVVRSARPAKAHIIACSGVFGRDSSHAKLATAFQSRNLTYAQVDASTGGKVWASVLYGKDPKQRLEVWWSQPAARSDTHLIVINGQSDWIAPGDLHLGLTLAELEKLNGKPFKLIGFDKDGIAAVTDWDGGTLAAIVGGCKIGVSLRADPHTPRSALADLPADRGFGSADAALRAAGPTVSEILVAY
jgi:hypothetical protein